MNFRRPLTWLLVLVVFSISGVGVGSVLDWVFWQISFNYIYPPRQFVISATKVAFLLGSLAAASATLGSPAPAKLRMLTIMWIAVLVSAGLFGVLGGLLGAGFSKWVVSDNGSGILAPRARLWFCEGLRIGTLTGAATSACLWNIFLIQCRFKRPPQSLKTINDLQTGQP